MMNTRELNMPPAFPIIHYFPHQIKEPDWEPDPFLGIILRTRPRSGLDRAYIHQPCDVVKTSKC